VPLQELIGKKIGTTQVFLDSGESVCVTAVRVGPCTVTQVKTADNDGYEGVQLGYEEVKRLSKPKSGHLQQAGKLFRYLREVKADDVSQIEVGQEIDVSLFQSGDRVDATGLSKGRGFAGGVKRHGFRGGPKTHGQSDRHRAPGSIGAGSSPGRVIKGLRMAGHMGNARVTVRNLRVIQSDPERSLLFVKGAVPGARNSLLTIRRSGKRA
jgi:large subunit ribosomal protein L3